MIWLGIIFIITYNWWMFQDYRNSRELLSDKGYINYLEDKLNEYECDKAEVE
jgi:hypothetical protein